MRKSVIASTLILTLAACGGGTKSVADTPKTWHDLLLAYESAICHKEFDCCTAADLGPSDPSDPPFTYDTCMKAYADLNTDDAGYKPLITMGVITYDSAKGAACLDAIAAEGCVVTPQSPDATLCVGALSGTLSDGANCDLGGATDTVCKSGHCGGIGDAPSACSPFPTLGQPCEGDGECAAGFYCDTDDGDGVGTNKCLTLKANGAACGPADTCASGYCDTTCKPYVQTSCVGK